MMGGQYAALYARKNADGGMEIVYVESEGSDKDKSEKILSVVPLAEAGTNENGKAHEITFRMIFVRRSLADVTDEGKVVLKKDPSEAEDLFFANAEAEKPELFIFWSADGEHFRDSGCRYTPSDHTWVGAKIGLFALAALAAMATAAWSSLLSQVNFIGVASRSHRKKDRSYI